MSEIDDIKDKLDVVDIVGESVQLLKAGRNFKGLCPFHAEKTPSFMVSPERQSWHCFGCGTGGDIFSFVMKKDGLDFGQVVQLLAEKAGVTLKPRSPDRAAQDKEADGIHEVNEAAISYYHHVLLDLPEGKIVRDYLAKREINSKTIDDFKLGCSPDSWDGLQKNLTGRNVEELVRAGLVVRKEDSAYDMFRGRLMFPIYTRRDKAAGFGGRVLDSRQPKYINSPQTNVFSKSDIIYGLQLARSAIRKQDMAIVVEGYMDVLTAHQHGMENVVACMGTAITESQIDTLSKLAGSIVLALDADAAGNEATLRGIEVARQALARKNRAREKNSAQGGAADVQTEIRVVTLPEGKDPDELIRQDIEVWRKAVDEALPLVDYVINVTTLKLDLSKPRDKSVAAQKLLPLINDVGDAIQKELYLKKLSVMLDVKESTLAGMAARTYSTKVEKTREALVVKAQGDPLEERCLCLLLAHPNLRDNSDELAPEYFITIQNQQIYIVWRDNPQSFRDEIDASLQEHLESLLEKTLPPADERERQREFVDCVTRLKVRRLKRLQLQLSERYDEESYAKDADGHRVTEQKMAEYDEEIKKGYNRSVTSNNREE